MAETYREIQTTEVDSGSPLTAELAEAWRANWIAGFEGASGAPRIEADAFQGSVAGTELLFSAVGPGDLITTGGQAYDATFRAIASCEVRVEIEVSKSGGATSDPDATVEKNGSTVLTALADSSYTTFTVDVSLVAGDVIKIYGEEVSDGGGTSQVNFREINYKTGAQRSFGGI